MSVKLPVAIYLRKSRSDVEAEARGEGETLSRHKTVLLQLAEDHQYFVCAVYQEIVSGDQIIARPQIQSLLSAVTAGRFHAVLCMDLDRLGRGDLIDQGLIQKAFKNSGTLVVTPRKVYDLRDEWDEEWSEFEAFFARRELKMITRRLQRGRRLSAAEGKSISQRPPYGYRRNPTLRLEPDPLTAPVVQKIFQLSKAGNSHGAIARKLNEEGIPAPRGGPWGASSIAFILKNPAYTGTIVWGRHRYHKAGRRYQREAVPEDLWIKKPLAHPPLVAPEDLPQPEGNSPSTGAPPVKPERFLNPLATILRCYHCGRPMQFRKSYGKRQHRLICATPSCNTKSATFLLVRKRVIEETAKFYSFLRLPYTMLQEALLTEAVWGHMSPTPAHSGAAEVSLADILQNHPSPEVEALLLQELIERIIYRRDRDWPQNQSISLEFWMKI